MARSSNLFAGLKPFLRPWAQALLDMGGARVQLTSVKRSRKQQELLWRRFQAGLSQFPAAPPGSSSHEKGLAFDIYSTDSRLLEQLGRQWEAWGGVWGGRFNDPIHFEFRLPKKSK